MVLIRPEDFPGESGSIDLSVVVEHIRPESLSNQTDDLCF